MRTYLIALFVAVVIILPSAVLAQTQSGGGGGSGPAMPIDVEPGDDGTTLNFTFDRDLYYGMRKDPDVSNLQEFLIDQGFLTGSPTGNFFLLTRKAVQGFQKAHSLRATGYFGPLSRTVANKILAGTGGGEGPGAVLTVTAPLPGAVWQIGSIHTVKWTPYDPNNGINPASDITAYLVKSVDQRLVRVGEIVESGKASIHWDGGLKGGAQATPGSYSVEIVNNKTKQGARSTGTFTLAPWGSVTADIKLGGSDGPIKVPQGGGDYVLTWNSNADSGCTITTPDENGVGVQWTTSSAAGDKKIYLNANTQGGSQYLSISCNSTKNLEGSAYDYIELLPLVSVPLPDTGASVSVLSPNGGEVLDFQATTRILWSNGSHIDKVSVALYKNDTFFNWIAPIHSVSAGKNFYEWKPSQSISAANIGSGIFKIYIIGYKSDGTGTVEDKSDAPFSIVSSASGGQLSVALDASSPSLRLVPAGSTDVPVTVLRFTATGEAIALQQIALQLKEGAAKPWDVMKYSLYDGPTKVGEGVFIGNGGNSYTATITLSSPVMIPAHGSKILMIKANLALIGVSQPGNSGSVVQIDYDGDNRAGTYGVGQSSRTRITSGTATDSQGSGVVMYRSVPTLAKLPLRDNVLRTDRVDLYRFSVRADAAGDVSLEKFVFNVSGGKLGGATNFNLYAYTDDGFSIPAIGTVDGLGAINRAVQRGEDGIVKIYSYRSDDSRGPIVIPAGDTRYFVLRADIDLALLDTLKVSLRGDSIMVAAHTFANADSAAENDFIWSGNSQRMSLLADADWNNGYAVSGLPSAGMQAEVLTGGSVNITIVPVLSPVATRNAQRIQDANKIVSGFHHPRYGANEHLPFYFTNEAWVCMSTQCTGIFRNAPPDVALDNYLIKDGAFTGKQSDPPDSTRPGSGYMYTSNWRPGAPGYGGVVFESGVYVNFLLEPVAVTADVCGLLGKPVAVESTYIECAIRLGESPNTFVSRNAQRIQDANKLISAFNSVASSASGVFPAASRWTCISNGCRGIWSATPRNGGVDIELARFIIDPLTDPSDSTRTLGGYLYHGNWQGGTGHGGVAFQSGAYLDFALEPTAITADVCDPGKVFLVDPSYIECLVRLGPGSGTTASSGMSGSQNMASVLAGLRSQLDALLKQLQNLP
ncbi:MAG: peptidoglycan-binding protein [Candidatus Sungbacteria bacterium]|nr:peptidoglycan-binding protein [Candidatus Sungbacteria bacterium]